MGSFTRDELEAAWAAYLEVQLADDWDAYVDIFTADAVYHEHEFGVFEGPEAIRAWLVPIMAPLVGWTYPVDWVEFGEDRVLFYWRNVMPSPEGDDEVYEFPGLTVLTYAGDGKWSRQEDIYNAKVSDALVGRWLEAGGKFRES